ncbi:hypothetical protein MKK50_14320 [Methylobacterium sp. J-043]|nr:hypothetical protein [Methylobacterium sp. J-043]
MGVTVHHDIDRTARSLSQIPGHDLRRPAQEGERRGGHAGDPQRDEVFLPAGMRPFDERDRVGSIRVGAQDGMIGVGKVASQRLARGSTLVPRLDSGAQVDVREVGQRLQNDLFSSLDDRGLLARS